MSLEELAGAYRSGDRQRILEAAASVDPSEVGPHGATAVHMAAQHVDPEVMGILLSKGCRAGATDEYGRTPLHILAVQRWDGREAEMAECTRLLLDGRCPPSRRDDTGKCFYHQAADLHNLPMISVMGERRVRCDAVLEGSLKNALHILCEAGGMFDYLRETDPEEFDRRDAMCRDMAEWLIGCGIDPEAETLIGRRAIDFAIEKRLKRTAEFLAGGREGTSGGMDLSQAAVMNDEGAIREILADGGDPDRLCDADGEYNGMSPLMIACRRMARGSALALLEGGASASLSAGGRTALYHLLRSLGSIVGTGTNDRDATSFIEMLRAVVSAQGSPDLPVDEEEGPALCFLAGRDWFGYTEEGRSVRQIAFDELLRLGASVDVRDGRGRTPLILACTVPGAESENIVSTLMEMGADCDARDSEGMTAVMRAASIPRDRGIDLIRTMFDFYDPDLSVRGVDGRDAMEIAAGSDSDGVLRLLLERAPRRV